MKELSLKYSIKLALIHNLYISPVRLIHNDLTLEFSSCTCSFKMFTIQNLFFPRNSANTLHVDGVLFSFKAII